MIRYFISGILFYCASVCDIVAQPPHIDSMSVTNNGELVIYGDVGPTPKIFIDSISIPVTKSDTNYCMCVIPDTGRGTYGYVYVISGGYQSNAKLLTRWDINVDYGSCNKVETYHWWYDLYSFLQGPKVATQLQMQVATIYLTPEYIANPTIPVYVYFVGDVPVNLFTDDHFQVTRSGTGGRKPCDINETGYANFLPPIAACHLVVQPTLLLPDYLSTQSGDSIKFVWKKGLSIESYHLQVATNYLYTPNTSVLVDIIITDTTFLWPFTKAFAKYFWRVQGINNEGTTAWAGTWIFTPDIVNAVVSEAKLPASNFWLSYNFANSSVQVNSVQTINSLTIFDILGREIRSLQLPISKELNGINIYDAPILDLPKGSYFVKATNSSNLYTGYFYR